MVKPGRKHKITGGIAEVLAEIKKRHPDWSARDLEKSFDGFAKLKKETLCLVGKGPKRTAISFWNKEYESNKKILGTDRAWTTAELTKDPLNASVVRWMIALQSYRKLCYSKPLIIREAKWFSHLSGLRSTFSSDLSNLGVSSESRDVFITHVLACWAQIYAYRQEIDILAGIENPDFSDLDDKLAKLDLNSIYEDNNKLMLDEMDKIVNRQEVSKKDIEDFDERYLRPSLIDNIRFQEMDILGHNLGDPDMSRESVGIYSTVLTWILRDNPPFFKSVLKLPYQKRTNFLISFRRWVKDNPNVNDDITVSKINELFDSVGEKGKNKAKFNKGYRITIDDLKKMKENYVKEGEANG